MCKLSYELCSNKYVYSVEMRQHFREQALLPDYSYTFLVIVLRLVAYFVEVCVMPITRTEEIMQPPLVGIWPKATPEKINIYLRSGRANRISRSKTLLKGTLK